MTHFAGLGQFTRLVTLGAVIGAGGAAEAQTMPREAPSTQRASSQEVGRAGPPKLDQRHALLYEGSISDGVVNVYDLSRFGFPRVQQISSGVSQVCGLAIDSNATLYVCNLGTNTISVYPFGAQTPSSVLADSARRPATVAVAPNGTVFVGCGWTSSPAVDEYLPGATSPSFVITDPLIVQPANMAFDSSGDAFIGDAITGFNELPSGSTQPTSLGLQGLQGVSGVALDEASARLYVTSVRGRRPFMNVYALGQQAPLYHYDVDDAEQFVIGSGKFDYLFLPDASSSTTTIYRLNAKQPFATLLLTNDTVGVAFKPSQP